LRARAAGIDTQCHLARGSRMRRMLPRFATVRKLMRNATQRCSSGAGA
jgi:hypothetical protein